MRLLYLSLQEEPYLGIVKAEGNNHFEMEIIRTGQHFERHFCDEKEPLPFYPGYVLSKLDVEERGGCGVLRSGIAFVIVRGKDIAWKSRYGYMTYDDGQDRPVLAHNCHNTHDDQDVNCDGGVANFQQEARSLSSLW